MSDLIALAYVSTATDVPSEAELEALLVSARTHNERCQVSGTLLFHDGTFLQYLEGPRAGVDETYARIKSSKRHHGIVQLFYRPTEQRHFAGWHMGFAHTPKSVMLKLSQASWLDVIAENDDRKGAAPGVKLLLEFWRNANRRR